jgi:(S)-ureidoglycine aminohydrolase
MKGLLVALTAVVLCVPAASAQIAPVKAGVYHWADLQAVNVGGGRVERVVLIGSTLDLDTLEVRAITLPPNAGPDSGDVHDSTETFTMVKEGKLWVTLNGVSRPLGAGSVAVAMPGDRQIVSNIGGTPATYFLFTYRSREPMDLTRAKQAGGSFMVGFSELTQKPTASGARRDVLNRPTAMFKRFESHWTSVNQGLRNHATHTHRADEFMMMMGGNVDVLIGKTEPPATSGDVVFLGSMIPHSLASKGAGPAQYLVIQGE